MPWRARCGAQDELVEQHASRLRDVAGARNRVDGEQLADGVALAERIKGLAAERGPTLTR